MLYMYYMRMVLIAWSFSILYFSYIIYRVKIFHFLRQSQTLNLKFFCNFSLKCLNILEIVHLKLQWENPPLSLNNETNCQVGRQRGRKYWGLWKGWRWGSRVCWKKLILKNLYITQPFLHRRNSLLILAFSHASSSRVNPSRSYAHCARICFVLTDITMVCGIGQTHVHGCIWTQLSSICWSTMENKIVFFRDSSCTLTFLQMLSKVSTPMAYVFVHLGDVMWEYQTLNCHTCRGKMALI